MRAGLPHGLRAFRHRNFSLFWGGQLISLAGTWMQQVAQGWLVFELTNDPLALGVTAAAQFTPVLVFGLFGGLIADVLPKRQTLIGTQVVAGLLAVVLGLLVASGQVQVWHVFLLAGLLGLVNAVDMPVRQSFVVEMVGRADIANAVALNSAVFNATRIIGPAIAGVLIGSVGLAICFFFNAATYLAVIGGLLLMRTAELQPAARSAVEHSVRGVARQLGEGLLYVRHTPTILLAISVLGIVATVGMNFNVLMPVIARDVLGGGADTFGFLMAASGLGSLLSALMIAFGPRPTLRRMVAGAGAFGIALVGLSFSTSVIVSLLLMVLLGWALIAMAATINTLIQLDAPDLLRGRVMSIYTTVFAGSTPLGGIFSGTVASLAGAPTALLICGVLTLLTAAAALSRLPGLLVPAPGTVAGRKPS